VGVLESNRGFPIQYRQIFDLTVNTCLRKIKDLARGKPESEPLRTPVLNLHKPINSITNLHLKRVAS